MEKGMSLEKARQLAELTDRIVSNLKVINADGNDLEEILMQTGHIADNLKVINSENNADLEVMLEQTGNVVNNLSTINEDENDLDTL
jgi:transcriptional regulator